MAKPRSLESCSIIRQLPSIFSSLHRRPTGSSQIYEPPPPPKPPELEHPPRLQHERRVCLFASSCQVPQLVQRALMVLWPRRKAAGRMCPAASRSAASLSPRLHKQRRCSYDTPQTRDSLHTGQVTLNTQQVSVHTWQIQSVSASVKPETRAGRVELQSALLLLSSVL